MKKIYCFKQLLILSLLSLASCAMTDKYFPTNAEYNTLIVKADSMMHEGLWAKAASLYEEAASLRPDELNAKLKQAQAYQNDGKLAQAFNTYQLVIDSKAPASDSNNFAKKQAKILQAKSGFKVEPLPVTPEIKPEPVVKSDRKLVEKSQTAISSVNADTTPAPAIDPKQVVLMDANKEVLDVLSGWRQAWVNKKPSDYFAYYVESFSGDASSPNAWRQQRKERIVTSKPIKIVLYDVQVKVLSDALAEVDFKQTYQSGAYKDSGHKTMQLQKLQGRWLISQERFK